ncbi:LANO_0D09868g1_1 [Lachancea nothofagi CBS 11611]|uniref:Eukaryotic translation initiation factor 2A n=1 Tax=Lachancea nothofagi CBS 11611 TaxID=1266666 RepID=A0A1G4JJZ4_9SACH|nr:LANO_0D09868g1_1 [Lachancea nothofagi CBS 11611]
MSTQFFAKTSTEINLFQGYPTFDQLTRDEAERIQVSLLSPCGRFMALSTSDAVQVFTGVEFSHLLLKVSLKDVYDLHFSPSGNFLSTWERPSISEPDHKNVKIWDLNLETPPETPSYAYQAKVQSGWVLQFSKLDNFALKQFGKEIRIVKIDSKDNTTFNFDKPFSKLIPEQHISSFLISPSEFPTICTFSPEKSGKPAVLSIYSIAEGITDKKIASKTFFKADSCQLKWNPLGNAVLCMAITDFDSSNKSYYGENTLYLLSFQGANGSLGGKSVRVPLSKEGPIHDFTWSPTSRQFGVIYGYMPATITFFDLRGNVVHSLPEQPKNTMLFSPSGRYILIAGFGNLQGSVEVLDRHDKFKCVTKFDAANTSVCKWSPGGEFILTATTSPRLRVDNGLKIWHVTGTLCFVKEYKELLKVDWRHQISPKLEESHVINSVASSNEEPFTDPKLGKIDVQIHPSATEYISKRLKNGSSAGTASKPAGAYRPPHARRAGGAPTVPGAAIRPAKGIPGMASGIPGVSGKESKASAKNKKKRENNKKEDSPDSSTVGEGATIDAVETPKVNKEASPEEKKIRSLLKKLRAIEALKQKQMLGETLEDTQILKIQSEDKVLKELDFLGWKDDDA